MSAKWSGSACDAPLISAHEDRHGLAAANGDGGVVDAHGERVAAEQAFVQDFDLRALCEAKFEKAALELVRRHAGVLRRSRDAGNTATKAAVRQAQRHGDDLAHK